MNSGDKPARPYRKPRTHHAQPLSLLDVPGALLTLETVMSLTGHSKSTIYRLMGQGDFPERHRVTGRRAVRWLSDDIKGYTGRFRPKGL